MPLRSRIFELNGLKFGDFPEKKQKELLEGLLQESESFWGHERNVVPHKLAELSRYYYRTLVESKDASRSTDSSTFEMTASLAAKDMKSLQNTKAGVKLENPERTELTSLSKVACSAIKTLDAKHGELSSECIALENSKFAFKAPEIRSGLENLKSFVDDLRKTQVLLDRKLSSMDEAACKAEKADIEQWNRKANEHLDNVKLLLKKVKGWLA